MCGWVVFQVQRHVFYQQLTSLHISNVTLLSCAGVLYLILITMKQTHGIVLLMRNIKSFPSNPSFSSGISKAQSSLPTTYSHLSLSFILQLLIIRPVRILIPPILQQHTQRQDRFLTLDLGSDPDPLALELRAMQLGRQMGEHGYGGALDGASQLGVVAGLSFEVLALVVRV